MPERNEHNERLNDLETAWRDGYANGYTNGSQDQYAIERGNWHGSHRTEQDREEAWLASDTRTIWEKRLPAPRQEQESPFTLPSEQLEPKPKPGSGSTLPLPQPQTRN